MTPALRQQNSIAARVAPAMPSSRPGGTGGIRSTNPREDKVMAVDVEKFGGSLSRLKKREAVEFRLLFLLTFPLFLAAAALARLIPGQRRSRAAGGHTGRSLIAEAKAAANTYIPFAFMR
jgi:hypothetical protein